MSTLYTEKRFELRDVPGIVRAVFWLRLKHSHISPRSQSENQDAWYVRLNRVVYARL